MAIKFDPFLGAMRQVDFNQKDFVATNGQTVFDAGFYIRPDEHQVAINGQLIPKDQGYTLDGTELTFTTGQDTNTQITIISG